MKTVATVEGALILVDDEDYGLVSSIEWKLVHGYPDSKYGNLHRLLFLPEEGCQVDHVDCDKLNNQKSNLRSVTRSQNQWNKRKSRKNSTGYKGVSFDKFHEKYSAKIKKNGIQRHLGYFDTAEEAAYAYSKAANALHGKYARTE